MEAELKVLEDKINQLVRLCQRLRTDNVQLRQELAASINENKHLLEKIHSAQNHLEALLNMMPEE